MSLDIKNTSFTYDGEQVIHGVTLSFVPGKCYGIVGPNGSGKSTLLDLMAGHLAPSGGDVLLKGRSVRDYGKKALAREISLVPQTVAVNFSYTAQEIVMMGRYPHIERFSAPATSDFAKVDAVMAMTETALFKYRRITQVSGGERQRIMFARALAQDAAVMLLDEATANLDINHAIALMGIVSREVHENGKTAVCVLQDINLAAMYCDELVFLKEGAVAARGPVDDVLNESTVNTVFNVSCHVAYHPHAGATQVVYRKPGTGAPLPEK